MLLIPESCGAPEYADYIIGYPMYVDHSNILVYQTKCILIYDRFFFTFLAFYDKRERYFLRYAKHIHPNICYTGDIGNLGLMYAWRFAFGYGTLG